MNKKTAASISKSVASSCKNTAKPSKTAPLSCKNVAKPPRKKPKEVLFFHFFLFRMFYVL